MQAFTTKPEPRILLMVFALAGDSTITTGLPLGPFLEDFFFGLASVAPSPSPLPSEPGASSTASGAASGTGFLRGFGAGLAEAASGAADGAFCSASGFPAFFFGFFPA